MLTMVPGIRWRRWIGRPKMTKLSDLNIPRLRELGYTAVLVDAKGRVVARFKTATDDTIKKAATAWGARVCKLDS